MNDPDRSVFEGGGAARQDPGATMEGRGSSARDAGGGLLEFGERQRLDFERSPRPMCIFDRETLRYLAVNDAALALYGYSREEFLALTLRDTRHPEGRHDLLEGFDRPEGYFMHFEPRRHVKKSGETLIAEVITQDVLFNGRAARVSLTIDVTERTRVSELIRQQQQEFETLAEHLPDLVARFDRSGRYVYVNSAVERLTGARREAITGRTQRDLGMPESVVAAFDESLAEALRGGEAHKLEFGYRSAEGEDRLFEAYHVPERDATGEIATILCVARDITERKSSEQALHKNEEFLRRVMESSRDCIKVLEVDGRLAWMSTGGQRLMEIDDVTCVLGRSYLDFWSGADRESAEAALAAARAGGVSRFEGHCPSARGTERWWDEIVTPILGDDGKPERMLVVSREVTEAKKAGYALRDSEARFELAVEHTGLGMWDWNVRTGDVWRHARWARILGYPPGDVQGHICVWKEFCHPDDWPPVQEGLLAHFEGKSPSYSAQYRMRNSAGAWIWIRCHGKVIERDEAGTPLRMIGYIRDFTERKGIEDARQQVEAERLTQAICQRDALVREVHHRIKNHLQGIAGLLRNKAGDNPAAAETIEAAVAQLQSVAAVYGLQSELAQSGVPLCGVLEAICSSAEGLSAARVVRAFAADLGSVRLATEEAVPVAVALNELISNAIEHGAGRGGATQIEISLSEQTDGADVRIVNRGSLPARFDYDRGIGTGTGLGLVKTLLGPSGGKLQFGARDGRVEVNLSLRPPLVSAREQPAALAGTPV